MPKAYLETKPSRYYPFLDGLRAIAAFMVAFSHALLIFNTTGMQSIFKTVLLVPFNGEAAVVIFFLISSLVVGQSLEKKKLNFQTGVSFYIKRLIRLYPVYFSAFLISISILILFHNNPVIKSTSDWYNNWFNKELTSKLILENLTLRSVDLNINAWTLQMEFAVMFIFPIIVIVKQKTNLLADILLVLISFIMGYRQNQYLNLIYVFPFYTGLLITKWGPGIFKIKKLASSITFFISLSILLTVQLIIINPHLRVLIETLSGFYLLSYLVFVKNGKISAILSSDKFRLPGKISYSFYLLHSFFLYLAAFFLIKYLTVFYNPERALFMNLILGIISYLLTIPGALVIYKLIEKPSIYLSKIISS